MAGILVIGRCASCCTGGPCAPLLLVATIPLRGFLDRILEIQLASQSQCVGLGTYQVVGEYHPIAKRSCVGPGMDIVEGTFAVRIDIPIQTRRHVLHLVLQENLIRADVSAISKPAASKSQ